MCLSKESVALILAVRKVVAHSYHLVAFLKPIDPMDQGLIIVRGRIPVPPLPDGGEESEEEHTKRVKTKIREQLILILSERPGTEITGIKIADPQGNPVKLELERVMVASAVK